MSRLLKIEKIVFCLLVFFAFFQGRVIWHIFGTQFNEWTSAYLYLTDILIAAVIFLWLLRIYKNLRWENIKRGFRSTEIVLGVFLAVSALSIIVSNKFYLSFYSFVKIFEMALLFIYVSRNFKSLFSLERFWQIFIASASAQSVVAIIQSVNQKSLGLKYLFESPLSSSIAGVAKIDVAGQKIIRAYGLTPHPNILAAILILALFGLVYLFLKNYRSLKKWHKLIYIAALVLNSTALFFTFSRGVTLIGILALICWVMIIFFRQKNYRREIIIFFASLIVVFSLLSIIFWSWTFARYNPDIIGQSQALNLRTYYNNVALHLIRGSPIFGIGQGNFVWTSSSLGLLENWMYQPVHNIYLLIGSETGILGLAFFLSFLFILWRRAKKAAITPPQNCLIYIFYFIITIGLFDHFWWDLQQGQILFWLFLGVLSSFHLSPHSLTDKARPSGG